MSSSFTPSFSDNINSLIVSNSYNVTSVTDEKIKVLQWLSPLELDSIGVWFLETTEFWKWCRVEDGSVASTLSCSGDPGSGKTHISSLVIDTLCDQLEGNDVGVACLYCDFHAQEEQVTTSMMAQILASFHQTFICIDGLDEYAVERRPELLRDSPTTCLFRAGRPHLKEEVKKHLSEPIAHLVIKPHESDIKYITMKMSEDPDPDAMDSELESEIMRSISENSSNIFLFVGETSIHWRRQKLHQKVNGLHDVYAATLDRISRQCGDKPRLSMEWPLSVSELCDALRVEIGSTDLNTKNIPPIHTLLGSCLGLVTIGKETSRVHLIHSMLQEYLQAHTSLFDHGHARIAEVWGVNMPFLIYASYHWGYHAGKQMVEPVKMCALSILQDYEKHALASLLYFSKEHGIREVVEEGSPLWECLRVYRRISGLHYAVLFGFGELVTLLMELKSTDINRQDFFGSTSVHCGDNSIFTLLLRDPNICPDISDDSGNTLLFAAAELGNEMMVDPDRKNLWGRTPLHIAASNGHTNIVKLLLSWSDVDPISKTNKGDTPLHYATSFGAKSVAKLFLNLDNFNPNIANNYGSTPLSIASEYGHIGIVEMLLAMDNMDLNPVDGDSDTPILAAALGGSEKVVQLLFDCKGINRNQVNNKGNTLLHMAVKSGDEVTVKIVLELGDPDLNARHLYGVIPLKLAAKRGHEAIVRLLKAPQTHHSGPTGAESNTSVDPEFVFLYDGIFYGCHTWCCVS
ncbi:ankyrin [Choiromyces venosus 120613-1]|uniref:Ankyrin n=1 Tax=Choiromyces venosus 120613-1 TaxID=1336337 RepID=A0A3N4JMR5_9PEZI|nr:ankyrin [Choiromyces venosus 120613-1]